MKTGPRARGLPRVLASSHSEELGRDRRSFSSEAGALSSLSLVLEQRFTVGKALPQPLLYGAQVAPFSS